ncbi:trimeric LpxA-like protein [Blyttiomyces helicus]|uniref:Dynactin subunit 6 n=1 Tax=Blyttiomyces helicus TaxID=388810 RepID=A0A4P9W7J1_9FUNG|nr:trimeric LpxA-like protein [Blyttiomyces helicus]|eukprot:RKO88052.1 trimeric LpxA-like protein [Blyttiomyces helicus]
MATPRHSVICSEADVRGLVIFGHNTVVHPYCRIFSEGGGPITIGNNNILEGSIINRTAEPIVIGDDNVFEVGCVFEGVRVGNGCVIEVKAVVAPGTTLGDNCVVGAKCSTHPNEQVPSNTVIYGEGNLRRLQTKATRQQANLHTRHLDYLKEILPKYHNMRSQSL